MGSGAIKRAQLHLLRAMSSIRTARGLAYYAAYLDRSAQAALRDEVLAAASVAPFFAPVMPRTGRPFTVRMTNMGPLGWFAARSGSRYQPTHPVRGKPWPPIPAQVLAI